MTSPISLQLQIGWLLRNRYLFINALRLKNRQTGGKVIALPYRRRSLGIERQIPSYGCRKKVVYFFAIVCYTNSVCAGWAAPGNQKTEDSAGVFPKNGDTGPDFGRWLPACYAFLHIWKGVYTLWQKN
jgi:hypothetical protein